MFIASPAGGMSIEDVAEATPEKILKQPININGIIIYFIYFSFF
jgi:succinyl-CoA synthetase beta subunit